MSGGAMRKMAVYLGLVEDGDRGYDHTDYGYVDGEGAVEGDDGYRDDRHHDERYHGERHSGDRYRDDRSDYRGDARADRRPEYRPEPHPASAAAVTALADRRPAPSPQRAELSKITTLNPRTYNEARTIGEHFRDGTPVIMNLGEMGLDDAKRLVDFSAGLVFGLCGTIERVSAKVFLLSPANVSVAAEDKARIAENGFFNQS